MRDALLTPLPEVRRGWTLWSECVVDSGPVLPGAAPSLPSVKPFRVHLDGGRHICLHPGGGAARHKHDVSGPPLCMGGWKRENEGDLCRSSGWGRAWGVSHRCGPVPQTRPDVSSIPVAALSLVEASLCSPLSSRYGELLVAMDWTLHHALGGSSGGGGGMGGSLLGAMGGGGLTSMLGGMLLGNTANYQRQQPQLSSVYTFDLGFKFSL